MAARARVPREPRHPGSRQRGRGGGAVPGVGAPSRGARLRDRWGCHQGQRPRPAATAGVGGARSALGGCLEVPAHHRGDAPEEGDVERGQVRRSAPLRDARARGGGRREHQARDAAQRGGHPPQGHPRGRGRDRAARGRCDPAGDLPGAARGGAQEAPAPHAPAGALPVLQHEDDQAARGRVHDVPQPRLPRARVAAAQALRFARRDGHRWTRREAGGLAAAARAGEHGGGLLPAHARSS